MKWTSRFSAFLRWWALNPRRGFRDWVIANATPRIKSSTTKTKNRRTTAKTAARRRAASRKRPEDQEKPDPPPEPGEAGSTLDLTA